MKMLIYIALIAELASTATAERLNFTLLHDGRTFDGWIGDSEKTWRIENGEIVGGSLERIVPRNEFLRTTRSFRDFELRLQVKLTGTQGFVNSGIQIRSRPADNPPNEMIGYQADVGEGWWGALYDESRRNKVLAAPDQQAVQQAVKKDDWNEYVIRAEGKRIRTWINAVPMIDYTEPDDTIEQEGFIGLQIHGGGRAVVRFRDIRIAELPSEP